jgi:hypothetical protein
MCREQGSPIYAELCARAAADVEAGGPFWELGGGFEGHPILGSLPLRILGAAHDLVLAGRAPALAAYYPSAGGAFEPQGAWRALHDVLRAHAGEIAARLGRAVQTNEVRRSTALVGGFLRVARETRLPLRLREIGSSAGLNLLWDRYRYALGPHRWGHPRARLALETAWEGPPPDLGAAVRVADRRGCDVDPLDLRDEAECRRLASFVWPEQTERLARLRAAIEVARADPPPLERMAAGDFVARELAEPAPGRASVLFHTVMWWYVPEAERVRIERTVREAGARATASAPLAWLRLEGALKDAAELRLLLWPGGEDRLLARAHYHGAFVRWLDRGGSG